MTHLDTHGTRELLRFSTAGSVDDGKSTLIGRLLHDSHNVHEDHLTKLQQRADKEGGTIDLAYLTDGLRAEREQGITIDVAYRYFATDRRSFIIADTPGHEQYTRNMATGASTAQLTIVLVDARKGLRTQSRRHAFIAALMGIPYVVVAVNKMDLVGYDQAVFEEIRRDMTAFLDSLDFRDVSFVPFSALIGDFVVHPSQAMSWYEGPTLMQLLEEAPITSVRNLEDFRLPVQTVIRPDQHFRGYGGQVVSGILKKGDEVMVLPSRKVREVAEILTYDGQLDEAFAGMSITFSLTDELDISRGNMLVHPSNRPHVGRGFEAMIVWFDEQPLKNGKSFVLKHSTQSVRAQVRHIRHQTLVDTLDEVPAQALGLNEIGLVDLVTFQDIFFDPYSRNRATGSFILIDELSNHTVAAGMILPSTASTGDSGEGQPIPVWDHPVTTRERANRYGHRALGLWVVGADQALRRRFVAALERSLFERGRVVLALECETRLQPTTDSSPVSELTWLHRELAASGTIHLFHGRRHPDPSPNHEQSRDQPEPVRLAVAFVDEEPAAELAWNSLQDTELATFLQQILAQIESRTRLEAAASEPVHS